MSKLRTKPKVVRNGETLKEIPKAIFNNRDLLKIKFRENEIKGIPKEIANLCRLETLDVSGNKITQVYAKLFELQKLKVLNLNNNRLKNLPKQIALLKNLRILQLQNNNLQTLPEEIGELQNLQEINMSYNKLNTFPKILYKLKNLRTLWIGGNFFNDFPVKRLLIELPKLRRIYIHSKINYADTYDINDLYIKYNAIKGNHLQKLKEELNIQLRPTAEKTIFISYAHKDKDWLDQLTPYLKVLQNEGIEIEPWDDRRIKAGDKWRDEIKVNLENAEAAILLISTYFLASDFITKKELPPLLELAQKRGLKIYCIIVGYSRFVHHKELEDFQTVNDPSQPLSSLTDQPAEIERIFLELSNIIGEHFGKK